VGEVEEDRMMNKEQEIIIPRFEFRAFAQSFGRVIDKIRNRAQPELIRESTDVYLVTKANNKNNVKLRADLLDVKELIHEQKGLEQWYPALKLAFPIKAEAIGGALFPKLMAACPTLQRESYTAAAFLEEVIWPHPMIVTAKVFKQRFHFMINGCMVEINELLVNGAAIRSVAVEAADADAVQRTRMEMGLDKYANVNYLQAIKRIVGLIQPGDGSWY
jgi:hypothetical protein